MLIIYEILTSLVEEPIPLCLQKHIFGKPDSRITKWLFFRSPLPSIVVLCCYFCFILFGRKVMMGRKAFHISSVLIMYNSVQVIMSCYIVKEIFGSAYGAGYNLYCQPLDHSSNPMALRMVGAFWWVYVSKLVDLMDTIFFVIRKKDSQMSFLHVYHHSSMVVNWYLGALYLPGGQAFFSCLLNALVHVLMYTYYLLSAMGPNLKPYLWWKCYLTQIQLLQFVLVITHILIGASQSCEAPGWLTWWSVSYTASLVVLFLNFYRQTYISHFDLGCIPRQSCDIDPTKKVL